MTKEEVDAKAAELASAICTMLADKSAVSNLPMPLAILALARTAGALLAEYERFSGRDLRDAAVDCMDTVRRSYLANPPVIPEGEPS